MEKQLPVQVDWIGRLPEHLILTEAKLDPEEISIMGGRRILKNVATIYTEKVSLDNIRKTGTMTVNLVLDPASLVIAPGSKDRVTVEYVAKERPK
jgi:YbbR domain-containing protein